METLKDLMTRCARPGLLDWIGLRAERRAGLDAVDRADITLAGLVGDHGVAGKRAVTLIQAEHLGVIGAMLGQDAVDPAGLRRNLVVSGINLAAMKGRQVRIGGVVLSITGICAPCSRMEETFGRGGYSAVRGHGGWCAEVGVPGRIAVGDAVFPVD